MTPLRPLTTAILMFVLALPAGIAAQPAGTSGDDAVAPAGEAGGGEGESGQAPEIFEDESPVGEIDAGEADAGDPGVGDTDAGGIGTDELPDERVPDATGVEPGQEAGPMMQSIYDSQEAISRSVTTLSRRMDRVFGTTEDFPETAYDSVLRLRFIQRVDEGGGGELDISAGGKLSLPGTEERLSLVFLSDDFDDPLDRERGSEREIEDTTRRSLALRFLRPSEHWKTSVSAGLRSGDPIDLLLRFSLWRDYRPGEWHVRPGQSVFWYDERGAGTRTDLRIQHPLAETLLVSSDSNATWFRRDEQFYYTQVFSLLQPLARRRDLLWQIGLQGESEPNKHVTLYYAQLRWRSVIHRDWLVLELRPQLLRERINDFRTQLRLFFGFELLFGDPRNY